MTFPTPQPPICQHSPGTGRGGGRVLSSVNFSLPWLHLCPFARAVPFPSKPSRASSGAPSLKPFCFSPQLPQFFTSEPDQVAFHQEPCPSEAPSSASLSPREAVHGIVSILLMTKQEERLKQLPRAIREDFCHPGSSVFPRPSRSRSGGHCGRERIPG